MKPQLLRFFCLMQCFVYILQSQKNKSFYKGSTDNLVRRFRQHNEGKDFSSKRYRPWNLVWYAPKDTRSEAVILERKLKNLSIQRIIEFINKYPVSDQEGLLDVAPVLSPK